MAWRNYFESTNAHYSTTADLCGGVSDGTIWKPANVHVSEVTVNRRWLIVYVTTDAVPSLWHVITDSLGINCNERSLTVTLRNLLSSTPEAIHRIRFHSRQEFWVFVANVAFARVHAHNQGLAEPARASGSGEIEEHAMTEG